MTKKCFIKAYHKRTTLTYSILYAVLMGAVYFWMDGLSLRTVVLTLITLGLSYLTSAMIQSNNTCGIYIEDGKLYYKQWIKKKEIDINDIAAIKVERLQHSSKSGTYYSETLKGEYNICMLILKEFCDGMQDYNMGNIYFSQYYPKKIIAQTVYDVEFMQYLTQRKPDIIVMTQVLSKYKCNMEDWRE